jgi:hypothetical protein
LVWFYATAAALEQKKLLLIDEYEQVYTLKDFFEGE